MGALQRKPWVGQRWAVVRSLVGVSPGVHMQLVQQGCSEPARSPREAPHPLCPELPLWGTTAAMAASERCCAKAGQALLPCCPEVQAPGSCGKAQTSLSALPLVPPCCWKVLCVSRLGGGGRCVNQHTYKGACRVTHLSRVLAEEVEETGRC